jgi:LPS-assembly lipoprotein
MSSSDRRTILALLAALPAAACGFAPAYGPGGPARGLTGRVALDDPGNKDAFDLVGRLEERLGRAEAPAYRLSYTISVGAVGLGVTQTGSITRYHYTGTVTYTLRQLSDDKVVASGTERNFTSYSASGTVVSTAASERDARTRLMRILADQIVTALIAASTDWATA